MYRHNADGGEHSLVRAVQDLDTATGIALTLPLRGRGFPLLLSVRPLGVAMAQRNAISLPAGAETSDRLLLFFVLNDGGAADAIARGRSLTETETEILRALLVGETVRQIARTRDVSINTVQSQVRHILAKLGLESLNQLALWARAWQ